MVYKECISGGNMALYIEDQYILYYNMDAYWSIMMEYG